MNSSEGGTTYQYQYKAAGARSVDGSDCNGGNGSYYDNNGGHSNMSVRNFDTGNDSRLYSRHSLLGFGHQSELAASMGEVSTCNSFSGISKSSEASGTTISLMDAVMGRKPTATDVVTTTTTAMYSTSTTAASAAALADITTTVTTAMKTAAANNATDAYHVLVENTDEATTAAVACQLVTERGGGGDGVGNDGDVATNPEQQRAPPANEQVTTASSNLRPKFRVGDLVVSRV
jgi:hypothetical protein